MRVGHNTLSHRRREEGDARGIHQLPDGVLSARIRRALPKHNQRPLRAAEQLRRLLDSLVQGLVLGWRRIGFGRIGGGSVDEGGGLRFREGLVEDVGWDVEVAAAGAAGDGGGEGLEDEARDVGDGGCLDGDLDERLGGGDLVELLEVAPAGVWLGAGAGDHEERPGVGGGVGEAREAVDAAGAGDGEEQAGGAGEEAVGGGGVARGLLVAEGEEADTGGRGADAREVTGMPTTRTCAAPRPRPARPARALPSTFMAAGAAVSVAIPSP